MAKADNSPPRTVADSGHLANLIASPESIQSDPAPKVSSLSPLQGTETLDTQSYINSDTFSMRSNGLRKGCEKVLLITKNSERHGFFRKRCIQSNYWWSYS